MIRIQADPWAKMVEHAQTVYPEECAGVMLGTGENGAKTVTVAVPMENVTHEPRQRRYALDANALRAADAEARRRGLTLVGIYHSHPDCAAYFSETDLKNSCPWYSFVVLSLRGGRFDHANSWLPDVEQRRAEKEELLIEEN